MEKSELLEKLVSVQETLIEKMQDLVNFKNVYNELEKVKNMRIEDLNHTVKEKNDKIKEVVNQNEELKKENEELQKRIKTDMDHIEIIEGKIIILEREKKDLEGKLSKLQRRIDVGVGTVPKENKNTDTSGESKLSKIRDELLDFFENS